MRGVRCIMYSITEGHYFSSLKIEQVENKKSITGQIIHVFSKIQKEESPKKTCTVYPETFLSWIWSIVRGIKHAITTQSTVVTVSWDRQVTETKMPNLNE